MENRVVEYQKRKLVGKLSPRQKDYLEAVDWLYNGARGTGRTHLICVTALLSVLHGNDGLVIDHSIYNEGMKSYTKTLLFALADSINLKIKLHEVRNGFVISRNPEWIEFDSEIGKIK